MHKSFRITAAAVALAAFAATGQPAFATAETVTRAVRVDYVAAEVMSEAGARRLYQRLNRAAGRACTLDGISRLQGRDFAECRRSAMSDAIRTIDAPQLSALAPSKPVRLARR